MSSCSFESKRSRDLQFEQVTQGIFEVILELHKLIPLPLRPNV